MEVPIVKRYLNEEEWWPVYKLQPITENNYGTEVQIPQDLVDRYAWAYREFKAVQKVLRKLYGEYDT